MKRKDMLISEAVFGHAGKKREGKRYVLRLLLSFFCILVLAVASVAVYLYSNRAEIKRMVVGEINRNLLTPVSVQDIKIEAWKEFPMLAVAFYGVSANGADAQDTEELFHAQSIALRFNLWDIIQKRYIVRDILVRGGDFNLKHYGKGRYNYAIWRQRDTLAHPVSFHLRQVLLRNTSVRFRDLPADHDFQLLARNVAARGDLYENGQDFHLKGEVGIHSMKAAGFVFLARRDGYMDVRFANEGKEKRFKVEKGWIKIENSAFAMRGYVCYDRSKPYMDFDFNGRDLRTETLLSLLPVSSRAYFSDYAFKGRLSFSMNIKGNYTRTPLGVTARFDYDKGQIRHRKSNLTASDVVLRGEFTNANRPGVENCRLLLDTLSARLPTGLISGRFSIADFKTPRISYNGFLRADLAELQTFFKLFPRHVLHGRAEASLKFSHTFLSLKPQDWKAADFSNALTSGYLRINDFCLNFPDERQLCSDSLYVEVNPRVAKTGRFRVRAGESEMELRLFVENLLPYLLLEKQNLYVVAQLKSRDLDWEKLSLWMARADKATEEKDTVSSGGLLKNRNLLKDLYADVELDVDRLYVPDIKVEHLKAMLRYNWTDISVEDLCFEALQGTFSGAAMINRQKDGFLINLHGRGQQMDIGTCFKSFGNFGQRQLTYHNIGGIFSTDFNFSAKYLSEKKRLDTDGLQLWADIEIVDGVLQNMEGLKKISRFTGEDDLQDIHFAQLHNVIEIRNSCIYIPEMQVRSTSGELSFSGTHTFGNEVDYMVNIELSELLSRRRAQRMKDREDFGVVTGGKSRVRLPLHIFGVWPDVEIKYAFAKARQGAEERLRENREELRDALRGQYSDMYRKRDEKREQRRLEKRRENGEFVLDMQEVGIMDKPAPQKTDTVSKKKRKYKTEEDFRIEFEED